MKPVVTANGKKTQALEDAETTLGFAPQNLKLPTETLTEFFLVVRPERLSLLERSPGETLQSNAPDDPPLVGQAKVS